MKSVLYTFLFKALRWLLGVAFGLAVAHGYITDGQAHYWIEAGVPFLIWLGSAFFSSVMHILKIAEAHRTDPNAPLTFAEIRASARTALFDLISNYVKNFKEKDESNDK